MYGGQTFLRVVYLEGAPPKEIFGHGWVTVEQCVSNIEGSDDSLTGTESWSPVKLKTAAISPNELLLVQVAPPGDCILHSRCRYNLNVKKFWF